MAITRRPVLTTFLVGLVAAALQVWWVARYRHPGGFGVDESMFLADALRYHRTLFGGGIGDLLGEISGTSKNAPLVPVTSALAMSVTGPSTTAALAVQAGFYLVSAVAIAGITRRLAGERAALVAGLVTLGLPALIIGARSYSFVAATSATMALAVWALLAARRGEDHLRMFAFGCAAGLMVISRTMAIAFLPGLAVGALILLHRNRRALVGAAWAMGGLLLIGAPWWIAQFADNQAYLVSFGYGKGTTQIETVPLLLRLPVRMGLAFTEIRPFLLLPAVAVIIVGIASLVRWRRDHGSVAGWTTEGRALAATVAVIGVSLLALLSSSNMGAGFQQPLVVLAIAPVCAIGARVWGPTARVAFVVAMAAVVLNVALISVWRPGSTVAIGDASFSVTLFGGTEDAQGIDFQAVDPRFAPSADWATRRQAEREWAALAAEIDEAAEELRPEDSDLLVSLFGENRLARAPTVALAHELGNPGRISFDQPARPEAMSSPEQIFDPPTDEPRILVFIRSPHYLTEVPVDPLDWIEQAEAKGWSRERSIPMPDGGEAVILTHPANQAGE